MEIYKYKDKKVGALMELILSKDDCSIKMIQRALNNVGKRLVVDGILGKNTRKKIDQVGHIRTLQLVAEKIPDSDAKKSNEIFGSDIPDWLSIAINEIGTKEIKGNLDNDRVLEYMHSAEKSSWVTNDEVPWCGGFVTWCIKNSDVEDEIPSSSLAAKSWAKFGVSSVVPVYGAIAVKKRKGGGHVGFVVGADESGKYVYILGGNQSDEVNVRKYKRDKWLDFRVPRDYKLNVKLSEWDGANNSGTKES